MNSDLKIIKKKYGEKMIHLCRELFPTLLETEGLLSKLMLDHFYPNHDLYDDIVNNSIIDEFKSYIYSFVDVETKEEEIQVVKTPKELLADAGYDLYECETIEDVERFKRYYSSGEELCTFRDIEGRLNRCHIFFAVKKDVDTINRENFSTPQREDLYGTSVISLQFTKDPTHTLSIKNRYNHTVNNPDSTFSNNLDNIIDGLTRAFENEYGLIQEHRNNQFEIPNYVKAKDGKYYKYNYEINNIYYCNDNIIIDNFEVRKLVSERHILFDYFVLDMQEKKIILYDDKIEDSFIESIGKINRIEIEKEKDTKKIIITPDGEEKEKIIITLDKDNRMISLINNNVKIIKDNFLKFNKSLTTLELLYLEQVGDSFLIYNNSLTTLELPNLQQVGNNFLCSNNSLTTLELPNLQQVGDGFLTYNNSLTTLELSNLQQVKGDFLFSNNSLTTLELPNLERVGNRFLFSNNSLTILKLPNLKIAGHDFLSSNNSLKILELPNLKEIAYNFLSRNKSLKILELPNIQRIYLMLCSLLSNTILTESDKDAAKELLPNNKALRNQILEQLENNKRR